MTNKILLAAIALGLWANAVVNYVRPARADTSCEGVGQVIVALDNIASGVHSIESHMFYQGLSTIPPAPPTKP